MADQDTPIPGVKTFQRLTKASVLAKDSHALDFVPSSLRQIILWSAENWDEDRIIALFDDGSVHEFTEAQWAQRQQELRDIDELIQTVSGAEEPAVFEFFAAEEYDNLLNWANKLDGGPSAIPEYLVVGDIVVRRPGGDYQVYRRVGIDRTEPGAPDGGEYINIERARIRLDLFKASIPYEAGQAQLQRAQEAESWIFGDSDTGSKG